jgi:NADH:ubiquinone oxidoreductase subunit
MEKLTKVKRKLGVFIRKFIKINKKGIKQNHFIPSGKTDENRPSDGKRQIIHKNFTETSQIPLDFSAGMGYAMLALKQKEC